MVLFPRFALCVPPPPPPTKCDRRAISSRSRHKCILIVITRADTHALETLSECSGDDMQRITRLWLYLSLGVLAIVGTALVLGSRDIRSVHITGPGLLGTGHGAMIDRPVHSGAQCYRSHPGSWTVHLDVDRPGEWLCKLNLSAQSSFVQNEYDRFGLSR